MSLFKYVVVVLSFHQIRGNQFWSTLTMLSLIILFLSIFYRKHNMWYWFDKTISTKCHMENINIAKNTFEFWHKSKEIPMSLMYIYMHLSQTFQRYRITVLFIYLLKVIDVCGQSLAAKFVRISHTFCTFYVKLKQIRFCKSFLLLTLWPQT